MNNQSSTAAAEINSLVDVCHNAARKSGWWNDLKTNKSLRGDKKEVGRLLMLMVSELAEAMEADRKNLMDDKLPHRCGLEVELADALIRICDFAGAYDLDLGGAVTEKLQFNASRADHKIENRLKSNGKKY